MHSFFPILLGPATVKAQGYLPPEPYGGMDAVRWMLDQEMRFPEEALAASTEGEVGIAFDVLANGSVVRMRVTKPLRPDCDAEALRLVRLDPLAPCNHQRHPAGHRPLDARCPFSAKRYRKVHAKGPSCERPAFIHASDESGKLYTHRGTDTLATPVIAGGLQGLPAYLGANLALPEGGLPPRYPGQGVHRVRGGDQRQPEQCARRRVPRGRMR